MAYRCPSGSRRLRVDRRGHDLAEPDFLAEALRGFDHPNVVMSYCQSKQMAPDGAILCDDYLNYVRDVSATKWTTAYVNDGLDEIVTALSVKNTIPNVSGVVFKREVLLQVLESMLPELKTYRSWRRLRFPILKCYSTGALRSPRNRSIYTGAIHQVSRLDLLIPPNSQKL